MTSGIKAECGQDHADVAADCAVQGTTHREYTTTLNDVDVAALQAEGWTVYAAVGSGGAGDGVELSNATPATLTGKAGAPGASVRASRADHVHPRRGGMLAGIVTLTAASGTYTVPSDVSQIEVTVIGGGGGGGGSEAVVGAGIACGAGGAGGLVLKLFTSPAASYPYAVGAGGQGGTSVTGAGEATAGGDSWFGEAGPSRLSAGGGGRGDTESSSVGARPVQGAQGGTASGGDLNLKGMQGGWGAIFGTTVGLQVGGSGASTMWGSGGAAAQDGSGFGASGGGGFASAGDPAGGGGGASGVILIREFA